MYFHSFSFDLIRDAREYGHSEVEVVDYAYGDSHEPRTFVSDADRQLLGAFSSRNTADLLPRGEFLYVKWRMKATGMIYEDRVDLRDRLPIDMTNYGIHFLIDGKQLVIFLLPPEESKDAMGRTTTTAGSWTRDIYFSERYAEYRKRHQIYPAVAK